MADDVVVRLRRWESGSVGRPLLYDEAADLIEALRESNNLAIKAITAYTEACLEANKRTDEARELAGRLAEALRGLGQLQLREMTVGEAVPIAEAWHKAELALAEWDAQRGQP